MPNPLSKGWKYLMASFDSKIDENADPKVQIQQATQAAKRQHQQITEQAAAVIGNQKQLEMKLDRLLKSQQDHQEQARTALQAADKAAAEGDTAKAQEYNNTAEIFASQLVAVEQQLEETRQLHAQATQNAEQATRQQLESEARLKEQLAQIDQLRAQAVGLRALARRGVEERAARAAPKIQLVVALVLVPSVLLMIAAALIANAGSLLGPA